MDMLVKAGATQALAFAVSYVALLAILGVALTVRVIGRRRAAGVGIGDGGDRDLARLIRVHGNFSETAPIMMILLIALALTGAREWMVHLVGISAILGRLLHAVGLGRSIGASWPREAGMALTFTAILSGALLLLLRAWA
jgi:hypothetical protein